MDLPIPDPKLVLSEAPQSRVSAGDIEQQGSYLAQGLKSLSDGLEQASVPLAEQAGRDAAASAIVTRDAAGNPVVQAPAQTFMFGRAGEAYNHAVQQGMLARGQTATAEALNNIRLKFQTDPQGFQTAADSYIAGLHQQYGNSPLGETVVGNATRLASQHFIGLQNDHAEAVTSNAKASLLTQIDDQRSTLMALARQPGGTTTEDFKAGLGKIDALYGALAANPLYKVPKDVAASELARAHSDFVGQAMVADIDRTFTTKGRAEAQQQITDRIRNNPDLRMPDSERQQLANYAQAHLEMLGGAEKAKIAATRNAVDAIGDRLTAGKPVSDADLDGLHQAALTLGDDESKLRIEAMQRTKALRGLDGLSPQQEQAAHFPNGIPGGPAPGASGYGAINAPYTAPIDKPGEGYAVSPHQFFSYLKQQGASDNEALMLTGAAGSESSFNPNAIHDGGRGFGLFGHNLQRLDLRQKGWQQQATAALSELRSRPEGAAVNAAKSADDLAVAQMRYERPRGYTDANPRGGDNFTGRLNTIRRFSSMAGQPLVDTGPAQGGGSTGNGPQVPPPVAGTSQFTAQQIADNPYLVSYQVRSVAADQTARERFAEKLGDTFEQAVKNGNPISVDGLASYMQIAAANPEKFGAQAAKLQTMISGQQLADQAGGLPQPQGQALIEAAKIRAAGGDVYTQQIADFARDRFDKQTAALKDNPGLEAVRRGWASSPPVPFDMGNPNTFGAAMLQRKALSDTIKARTGDQAQPILSPNDLDGARSVLMGPGGAQALSNLGATLNSSQMNDLFQEKGFTDSVVGMARSGDPAKMKAAFALLGQQYDTSPATFSNLVGESAATDLQTWRAKNAYQPPEVAAAQMIEAKTPQGIAAADMAKKAAEEDLKNLTPAALVSKIGGSLIPFKSAGTMQSDQPGMANAQLLSEYTQAYKDAFARVGDKGQADTIATDALKQKWGPTAVNGGALMKYPPELVTNPQTGEPFYPAVAGSRDYIKDQIADAVNAYANDYTSARGLSDTDRLHEGRAIVNAPHGIISDQITRDDIANGRAPSYLLMVTTPDGHIDVASDPATGRPKRIYFDPQPAKDAQAQQAQTADTAVRARMSAPPAMQVPDMMGF